jgi:hypothetical protein
MYQKGVTVPPQALQQENSELQTLFLSKLVVHRWTICAPKSVKGPDQTILLYYNKHEAWLLLPSPCTTLGLNSGYLLPVPSVSIIVCQPEKVRCHLCVVCARGNLVDSAQV